MEKERRLGVWMQLQMEAELSVALDVGCERKRRIKEDSREPSWGK